MKRSIVDHFDASDNDTMHAPRHQRSSVVGVTEKQTNELGYSLLANKRNVLPSPLTMSVTHVSFALPFIYETAKFFDTGPKGVGVFLKWELLRGKEAERRNFEDIWDECNNSYNLAP